MVLPEPIRVLIAEDVGTDAELSARELKRAGLRVVHRIVDSEQAFRGALVEFAPQIILSDFSMPQFDGMAALGLARELAPDIPFIFVSGTIGEEYAIRALKNGATDYVLKTNLVRLPAAVERAVADARERAARLRTEHELDQVRDQLRAIFDTLPDAVWSVSLPDERLIYMSPAARAVLGHEPGEFAGDIDLGIHVAHPDDRERVAVAWEGVRAGKPYDIEYRVVDSNGAVRWVHERARRISDAKGVPQRVDGIARDITEAVRQRERLARLDRIRDLFGAVNWAFTRIRDRDELLREFCRIAVARGGFALARIVVVDRSGKLSIAATTEEPSGAFTQIVDEYNRDPAGANSLLAYALRSGKVTVSNDMQSDARVPTRGALTAQGNYSLALFPIRLDGALVAMAALRAREANFFDQEELSLLSEMIANLEFALELMDKQAKLDYLAYYDPITGLPNRALFSDRLAQAIDTARSAGHKAVVLLFDIERFKAINDTFGTSTGDAVLRRFARHAADAAGEGASLARLGGNQFALLVPAVRDADHVGRMLESPMARMLDTMLEIEGRELRVAAKAGIALYPEDGADADALLRNAEAALKKAKASGERFVFYAPHLNARVAERLELEARLRRAVEQGEFMLHFQPRVELGTNRIMGVEALLRWRDGEPGMKSPALFVPVLEETGLINQVGQWAMREAVATHRAWAGRGLPAARIAVNVSAVQLRSRTFVDEVRAVLDGAGAAAGLDLEITESLLMENIEESLRKLRQIRDLGVNIALDDFGTGYSSLAYLSRLPIDTLKIDRSFIHNMTEKAEDTSIITAILSLARALGLKVVAEGVETEEQAQLLRLLRCDQMQGYLFSPAVPGERIEALLAAPA